jgi:putative peptide zinc metalloprotease protein
MALVTERTKSVAIRLAEFPQAAFASQIERVVPSAGMHLPSRALGTNGGGAIPVDPTDPQGLRVLENIFQLDLSLPPASKTANIGGRVYARFEHGSMPLAFQWYRSLRQLFLRRFDV